MFHITYYYSLLQKIDEEAVEYILEVIHSVINVVNRLIESGDGSMDFQVLAMKLDKMTENCKFRKAILSAFYNISQRNFGILLIL